MVLQFYLFAGSLPCKVVWSVLEALEIPYEKKHMDIFGKKEQKTPEYLAINPDGKVPYIADDDGFGIGESRAIICYLCSRYEDEPKKNWLYPKDIRQKATVDKALYQDFQYTSNMVEYLNLAGVLYRGESGPVHSRWRGIEDMLEGFERRFEKHKFMAADHVTVADYSALATVAGFQHFLSEEEKKKYPRLFEWLKEMESLPIYPICYGDSPAQFKAYYDHLVMDKNANHHESVENETSALVLAKQ